MRNFKITLTIYDPHLADILEKLGNQKTKLIYQALSSFQKSKEGREMIKFMLGGNSNNGKKNAAAHSRKAALKSEPDTQHQPEKGTTTDKTFKFI